MSSGVSSHGAGVVTATDVLPTPTSMRYLFRQAPRDFVAALVILFIESYCMFNFFNVLMWMLTQEASFTDSESGWIYAGFGLQTAIFTVLMGPVVDRILVRKAMFCVTTIGAAVCVVLGAVGANRISLLVVLFVPLPIAMGLATPVVQIAIRRYTSHETQTLSFALQYIFISAATACAQFTVDMVRLTIMANHGYQWSLFIGAHVALHVLSLFITAVWIRDVQVCPEISLDTGAWKVVPVQPSTTSAQTMCSSSCEALRDAKFWRLLLLCICVIGAKAVFVFMYTVYPLYMLRAPYDPPGASMPFMAFLMLDPAICVGLAWVVAAFVMRYNWERFWVIFVGATLACVSPFLMMPYSYVTVVAFIAVEAIGEAIWAPLFLRYSCEFTPPGREGVYFGLVGIVLFLGKLLGGMSGELMQHFCPTAGACERGYFVWLVIGCVCCSTPVLLLLTSRWTWIRTSSNTVHDAANDIVLGSGSTDVEEDPENKVDDFTYGQDDTVALVVHFLDYE